MLLYVSIILIILLILLLKLNKSLYEGFMSLEKLNMNIKNQNITKVDILNDAKQTRSNSSIRLTNKSADDKMISEFIIKQLGKDDLGTQSSYDTHTDMLKYPKPIDEKVVKPKLESKQMDYEDVIQDQNRKIREKKEKQNLTLRNINYELKKLNEFNKAV